MLTDSDPIFVDTNVLIYANLAFLIRVVPLVADAETPESESNAIQ